MRKAIELYNLGSWRVQESFMSIWDAVLKKNYKKSAVTLLILMNGSI